MYRHVRFNTLTWSAGVVFRHLFAYSQTSPHRIHRMPMLTAGILSAGVYYRCRQERGRTKSGADSTFANVFFFRLALFPTMTDGGKVEGGLEQH